MDYHKISEFVDTKHPITYANSKTEIKFKYSPSLFGYFSRQNQELRNLNQWNFIIVPQENNTKNVTIINGDDIESIHLHICCR